MSDPLPSPVWTSFPRLLGGWGWPCGCILTKGRWPPAPTAPLPTHPTGWGHQGVATPLRTWEGSSPNKPEPTTGSVDGGSVGMSSRLSGRGPLGTHFTTSCHCHPQSCAVLSRFPCWKADPLDHGFHQFLEMDTPTVDVHSAQWTAPPVPFQLEPERGMDGEETAEVAMPVNSGVQLAAQSQSCCLAERSPTSFCVWRASAPRPPGSQWPLLCPPWSSQNSHG